MRGLLLDERPDVRPLGFGDHGEEEFARGLIGSGSGFCEGTLEPFDLQGGELVAKFGALWRDTQQPLAAIDRARTLGDEPFVDQLLEDTRQRLFGDFENIEELGDAQAGIAVDEMKDPVMGAAEIILSEHLVRITSKIPVSEEKELGTGYEVITRSSQYFATFITLKYRFRNEPWTAAEKSSGVMSVMLTYLPPIDSRGKRFCA